MATPLAECDSCYAVYKLMSRESPATGELIPQPRCPHCGCTDYYDAPKGAKETVGDVDRDAPDPTRRHGRGGPRPPEEPSRFTADVPAMAG